ncbi:hypothetical protein [Couchioplanes caeruleus]|uniref:Uncharacterized protein n=1 Tax=Couchioplanes caeruleus subsp. caeruleus TaxID=56427 RepID=A0A1K0FDH9_9ACTN|nr:hypothetical protein [Couchioplanes caeruleus]OJF10893.1 hypothetical protein BG844_29575 [Couchioplanes caeruleus subsp. caeruleus]
MDIPYKNYNSIPPEVVYQEGGLTKEQYDAYLELERKRSEYQGDQSNPEDTYNPTDAEAAAEFAYNKWTREHPDFPIKVNTALASNEFQKFDPNTDYWAGGKAKGPDSHADTPPGLPDVPKTEGDGKASVSVHQEALEKFRVNLKELKGVLAGARTKLGTVEANPGRFGAGVDLAVAVNSDLVGDVDKALGRVVQIFKDIDDDCVAVIKQYDTVEEWNEKDAKKLDNIFRETFGGITAKPEAAAGGKPDPAADPKGGGAKSG